MSDPDVIIKVRTRDGKLYKVPDAVFVEICDSEGSLAGLVHKDPLTEGVVLYTSADEQFNNYCKMFKRKGTRDKSS